MRADIRNGERIPSGVFVRGLIRPFTPHEPTRKYLVLRLPVWRIQFSLMTHRLAWHRLVIGHIVCVEGCRQFDSKRDGWRYWWEEEYR